MLEVWTAGEEVSVCVREGVLLAEGQTATAKGQSLRQANAGGKVELELKLGHSRDGQFVSSLEEVRSWASR